MKISKSHLAIGLAMFALAAVAIAIFVAPKRHADPFDDSHFIATAWAATFTARIDRYVQDMSDRRAAFDERNQAKIEITSARLADDVRLFAYDQQITLPRVLALLPADERPKFNALVEQLWQHIVAANKADFAASHQAP